MSRKTGELLFQVGLVLGAIVVGKLLDNPAGYVGGAILAVIRTEVQLGRGFTARQPPTS